jgi:hypothetical protein
MQKKMLLPNFFFFQQFKLIVKRISFFKSKNTIYRFNRRNVKQITQMKHLDNVSLNILQIYLDPIGRFKNNSSNELKTKNNNY